MAERLRAVIVGAGLGGLAAAVALTRRGLDVRVYEQAAELGEVGAGIALAVNSWIYDYDIQAALDGLMPAP